MNDIISESFFIIDSECLQAVDTKLYGYCIAGDASQLFGEGEETNKILQYLKPDNYPDGAYVLVQNNKKVITISQDFNGGFGLYLYENNNYFAISNSFVLLVEHLKKRFSLTMNCDYVKAYFLTGLTSTAYSETMVNEIRCLPKDVRVIINKAEKKIDLETIDYKNNTVPIDSQEAMQILDKWYYKWINIIRYIVNSENETIVDLSGGIDSRLVFLLFLKSGINLKGVRVNSTNDELHTHKEDYSIATAIANRFNFELNINPPKSGEILPLSISDSIDIVSYSRLCFCTEISNKLSFYKKARYVFTGAGGEALRKHWDVSPKDYIKDITKRCARYNNCDFRTSVEKILGRAFSIAKEKYNVTNDSSSAIIDGFYRETRCRNHFGKEMALNSICNVFSMAPLLDSELTKICLNNCRTSDRNIIIAVIFKRYCPELLNFKFEGNRSIEESILEYAHEINSKYPLIESHQYVDGKWVLNASLEYKVSHSVVPITKMQAEAFFLNSFLSKKTYNIFTKHFNKEIYDDALRYSQKQSYHPEARLIPILGTVKILNDIEGEEVDGHTPYEFFKELLTGDTYYQNLFSQTFETARIDIKNFSEENNDNDIIIDCNSNCNYILEKPQWFHKNGVGYVITSSHRDGIDIEITCLNNGLLTLWLRSIDTRDKDNKRINYYVDYKKLSIDKQIKFDCFMPCSHDDYFRYTLPVKEGQRLSLHIEWDIHKYSLSEYAKLVFLIAGRFFDERSNSKEIELLKQVEKIKKEKWMFEREFTNVKLMLDQLKIELTDTKNKLKESEQNIAYSKEAKAETEKELIKSQTDAKWLEQAKAETEKELKIVQADAKRLEQAKVETEKELKIAQAGAKRLEQAKAETEKELIKSQTDAKWLEQAKVETEKKLKIAQAGAKRLEQAKAETEKKLTKNQTEMEKIERELKNVKNGWSFRLGRVLTWIPRKIKELLK